jgi:radical SAM protein with 4Fe4S-binding SPASM domain
MEAAIITTYRCMNKCQMCNIWKHPAKSNEEFRPELLDKLPDLDFANITGGEPFLRGDIVEIIRMLKKKAKRIVISTNGFLTDRILDITEKEKGIGIRISLEGLPRINDELRGKEHGFDHGLRTLLGLRRIGLKDIGFGITVSDRNAQDMLELYQLAKSMDMEFATAVVHNSYYFHKHDNKISDKHKVIECFVELINELLKTKKVKNWFRAYFNFGLINYIEGNSRLLPCGAGTDMFFLDPYGDIRPCNGMDKGSQENSMGSLLEQTFQEIWESDKAHMIRERILNCSKNCWMIGTASPAIKKNMIKPIVWVLRNKTMNMLGKRFSL